MRWFFEQMRRRICRHRLMHRTPQGRAQHRSFTNALANMMHHFLMLKDRPIVAFTFQTTADTVLKEKKR